VSFRLLFESLPDANSSVEIRATLRLRMLAGATGRERRDAETADTGPSSSLEQAAANSTPSSFILYAELPDQHHRKAFKVNDSDTLSDFLVVLQRKGFGDPSGFLVYVKDDSGALKEVSKCKCAMLTQLGLKEKAWS
jgi:hypothetical protein